MNIEEAQELVSPLIPGSTVTKTEDFGDLFAVHFVNDEFYASKKIEDMMVGAGPMMVEKATRAVFETGSGQSAAEYASAYKECGSVYGVPSSSICIFGAVEENTAILNLKSALSIGLKEAKDLVNSIRAGDEVSLDFDSPSSAAQVVEKLNKYNFSCKQLWASER
jgi:hypothetical protein